MMEKTGLNHLSDEATAAEVIDSRAFSAFCGVDSGNQVPDGDTIGRFRNNLVKSGLQEKLFSRVVSAGMGTLKKGTAADSALIAALPSAKNRPHRISCLFIGTGKAEKAVGKNR